jgi:hypothetical protein
MNIPVEFEGPGGTYSPEDIEKLCHILLKKLREKRGEFTLTLVAPH